MRPATGTRIVVYSIGLASAMLVGCARPASRPFAPELVSRPAHWINTDEPVTLERLRGKVAWLQFNFCESCTPLRHHLVRWHERFTEQGLVIIEIDGGKTQTLEATKTLLGGKPVRHRVLWDERNRNHERFDVHTWPRAWLVDAAGRVVWAGNPHRILRRELEIQTVENLVAVAAEETRRAHRTEGPRFGGLAGGR